jgi:hypothetical protein
MIFCFGIQWPTRVSTAKKLIRTIWYFVLRTRNLAVFYILFFASFQLAATEFAKLQPVDSCIAMATLELPEARNVMKTWAETYDSYLKYKKCEDIRIDELFAGAVLTNLVKDWKGFFKSKTKWRHDDEFHLFVLAHLFPEFEFDQIESNARHACPKGRKDFCAKIIQYIREENELTVIVMSHKDPSEDFEKIRAEMWKKCSKGKERLCARLIENHKALIDSIRRSQNK